MSARVRVRRAGTAVVAAAVLAASGGCASSSRSDGDWRRKTAETAEAAASAVRTAEIGVRAAKGGKATGPYLSVLFNDADKDLNEVQSGYLSRQPPSVGADNLRARVSDLLDEAVDALDALRIAVRRGQIGKLAEIGKGLPALAGQLEAVQEDLT
ncbi:hypothetical protein [Actinomadura parmotrematis]|uniref:Lipoprotein n=1 Tax=Actinomadura parmotrematis TaxID=2864039 RepID=A0ABS7G2F2_9ACTN|nr:hypothetical protein [Actinomadura parmotrematis]MBW8486857.1 hypothetical protein [Actinomadura parmotrematis]